MRECRLAYDRRKRGMLSIPRLVALWICLRRIAPLRVSARPCWFLGTRLPVFAGITENGLELSGGDRLHADCVSGGKG